MSGTNLHQDAITNARTGINEAAEAATIEGVRPFQAGSQTLVGGMRRRGGR